jgi:hypothetical protein
MKNGMKCSPGLADSPLGLELVGLDSGNDVVLTI